VKFWCCFCFVVLLLLAFFVVVVAVVIVLCFVRAYIVFSGHGISACLNPIGLHQFSAKLTLSAQIPFGSDSMVG